MTDLTTGDFDYLLPEGYIAYHPSARREESRLLVLDRATGGISHRVFHEVTGYLGEGDLLVVNDTRVIKARLDARKRGTGGKVELLFLRETEDGLWQALVSPSRRVHEGTELDFETGESAEVVRRLTGSMRLVRVNVPDMRAFLRERGEVPLPPYIKRAPVPQDEERYQTVYAREEGSVAAPTAGLHFTPALIAELEAGGVKVAGITLHVGMGTFIPVKTETPGEHALEPEYFEVGAQTAAAISAARREGRRIFAVGTTSVRVLETLADRFAPGERGVAALEAASGWTYKFIYPPYEFRLVNALITNFHLPRSTLLMLVCAFAGREFVLNAYEEAIREKYRFYSYGDAMLIT
ncbi:MAG: tRNA preQ1(34) S-adenosylmethionine ribosyltransferase-isomerase QueA [bacterium]|jgi:S-adenosylmethionine:tRNA ribosyltransferase-isomerase